MKVTLKTVLLLLSLPSPVSSARLGSCDRLFLVHNTQAWSPRKSRASCLSSTVTFKKNILRFLPSSTLTMFFSLPAHFLKICKDWPACSIPGVANTTWKKKYIVVDHLHFRPHTFLTLGRKNLTYHRTGVVSVGAIKGLDVLKFKHVSLYKGFSNLLVGPCYEKLVIMVCFLRQSRGEVDWRL